MSERMKKHPISAHSQGSRLYVTYQQHTYAIPKTVVEKYEIEDIKPKKKKKSPTEEVEALFEKLEKQYSKVGVMLKGLRYREDLTQVEFAKKLNVTQANLSNMENGRRPIGKEMAKRIAKIFRTDYRLFL